MTITNAQREALWQAHTAALAPLTAGDHEFRPDDCPNAFQALKGARQALREAGEVPPSLTPEVVARIVEHV